MIQLKKMKFGCEVVKVLDVWRIVGEIKSSVNLEKEKAPALGHC
jgi:hypothetical protein